MVECEVWVLCDASFCALRVLCCVRNVRPVDVKFSVVQNMSTLGTFTFAR